MNEIKLLLMWQTEKEGEKLLEFLVYYMLWVFYPKKRR